MAKTYEALLKAGQDPLHSVGSNTSSTPPGSAERHNEKLNRDLQKLHSKLQTMQEDHGIQVLLFSALGRRSGVTAITSHLARIFARNTTDGSVLLLDCNFHNPRLHKRFGFKNDAGITGVLQRKTTLENVVHRYEKARLDVVSHGEAVQDMSMSHLAEKLEEVIRAARGHYRWILIDAPAYNTAPELPALAKCTDGIILIVPQGHVKWFALKAVQQDFSEQHIPIMGGIINFREYYIPPWLYRFT